MTTLRAQFEAYLGVTFIVSAPLRARRRLEAIPPSPGQGPGRPQCSRQGGLRLRIALRSCHLMFYVL